MSMERCIQHALERHRKAIERLYDAKCNIYTYEHYTKPNGANAERKALLCKDQPCKVSYDKIDATDQSDNGDNVTQTIRLFLSPEIEVPTGSQITVIQNGKEWMYRNSGKPASYPTHQEIRLIPEEKRA